MNYFILKKLYIAFILAIIVAIAFAIYFLNQEISKDRVNILSDYLITNLRNEIEREKSQALSVAIALSENEALKDTLLNEDEEKGFQILNSATLMFKKYANNKNLKIQIITKDFYIFSRSWDNSYAGFPLEDFRADLFKIKKSKIPKVSIEIGRILSFFATVPIVKDGKVIGFLEVVELLDNLVDRFKKVGTELTILMQEEYLQKAILLGNNPKVEKYIIANSNYNSQSIERFKEINWEELRAEKYSKTKEYIYILKDMYDSSNKLIGAFLFSLKRDNINNLLNRKISFLIDFTYSDIYNITRVVESQDDNLNRFTLKELLYLRDIVDDKIYREKILSEIERRFQKLSKEEILNRVLDLHIYRKIEGEIR